MGTKTVRQTYLPCPAEKLRELEKSGPPGWKFHRATHSVTEHGDIGIRIFFARKPVGPPTPEPRDGTGKVIAQIFGRPMKRARFVREGAGVELTLEDNVVHQVPQDLADTLFAYRPERRPTLRMRTPGQWRELAKDPAPIVDALRGTSFAFEDVVIDILLRGSELSEFFDLGSDVEVRSVRGDWMGESIPGRGVCRGFALRVARRAGQG